VELAAREATEREQQQLLHEIQQTGSQLRAMAVRLQEVQELERHHIASELHDRVGQNLTGLNLNLQIIQNQVAALQKPALQTRLDDSLRLVEQTTRLVRDVMADLVPPQLEEYGLVSALRWYAGIYTGRTRQEVQVVGNELEPRLDPKTEIAFFRIVQEALNNIARHARASKVTISVEADASLARVCVTDNGMGFDPGRFPRPGDLGLITMKERAASVGGLVIIQSAPGQGTTVRIEFRRDPQ
jgi:signal transduction histidine kinase